MKLPSNLKDQSTLRKTVAIPVQILSLAPVTVASTLRKTVAIPVQILSLAPVTVAMTAMVAIPTQATAIEEVLMEAAMAQAVFQVA